MYRINDGVKLLIVLIICASAVGIVWIITDANITSGREKRAELRNCIATEKSPLECRVSVYGTIE